MSKPDHWPIADRGSLSIEGKVVALPGLSLLREAGRGANAVVFEATDTRLQRRVAVKVWNARGVDRSQFETSKIAKLVHPLIVTTHYYELADGYPYAVMEFVDATSGKQWLRRDPAISDRTGVWQMYSQALRFIHNRGEVHGDPHFGNVLVFEDTIGTYGPRAPDGRRNLGIKVADAGTSEFWDNHRGFEERESRLILETAARLFHDRQLEHLWFHPVGLDHVATLEVLDALCRYFDLVCGSFDYDRRSDNAQALATLLLSAPLFELDAVLADLRSTGFTDHGRLARRLNKGLFRIFDVMDASDEVGPETRLAYTAAREKFVAGKGPRGQNSAAL